jgi:hypothetical protein
LAALFVLSAVGGFACSQSVGGRCVQNSDCSSGICSGTGEGSPGVCLASTTTVIPPVDAQTVSDTGVDAPVDAPIDAPVVADGSRQDSAGATDAPVTEHDGGTMVDAAATRDASSGGAGGLGGAAGAGSGGAGGAR